MKDEWTESNGRLAPGRSYKIVEVHDSETEALMIFQEDDGRRHATKVYYNAPNAYHEILLPGCFTKGWKENPNIKYVWVGEKND